MPKVRMLTDAVLGDRLWLSGEEYDLEADRAAAFARDGIAEYVTTPRPTAQRGGRKVETASATKPAARRKR